MKTIKDNVLYFHDFLTDEDETQEEIRMYLRKFHSNGIEFFYDVNETDVPPFDGARGYDILLFDWGGASFGNSMMRGFCIQILDEATECPNRIYIMVSSFTKEAMEEAQSDFVRVNGNVPVNVFLDIESACEYLNKYV